MKGMAVKQQLFIMLLEIMNMLIDGGADVNIMDYRQLSPLWVACDRRKGDAVLMLLRRSAKVQLPIERARWTNCTMCQAAEFEPTEVMGALCERSIDHYNEPCYRTPLWEAVTAENLMAVKCLIMYGCSLDTPGRESSFGWKKRTLLHEAIYKKNLNVLNVLITAGALTNKTLFECSSDNALHGDYVGRTGLEVIKLEFILRLKIKRNDWLLADTCPQAAIHCALF